MNQGKLGDFIVVGDMTVRAIMGELLLQQRFCIRYNGVVVAELKEAT